MKWSGAAPCQCHSPPEDVDDVAGADGGDGLAVGLDAPHAFRHIQRLADRVAVPGRARAGAKCTDPMLMGEGPCACAMASIHTSPVNHSTGPFVVGVLGWTSMRVSLPFLLAQGQSSALMARRSSMAR
jgi:hypothetical protein